MTIKHSDDERAVWARRAMDFVRSIGIKVEEIPAQADLDGSFLPNVRVVNGSLEVVAAEVFPGDILHEAGHLAVIPAPFRPLATGDLSAVEEAMGAYLEANPDGLAKWPEDPVSRAIFQSSDQEATAWQFAAAKAMQLPDVWLFPEDSYDGEADVVLQRLQVNEYMGINGLQAAGWTQVRKNPVKKAPVFPELAFWLHPGAPPNAS